MKNASGLAPRIFTNTDVGLYLKYASSASGRFREFIFTFHKEHLDELRILNEKTGKVFIGLICVAAAEICCLPYSELLDLLRIRKTEKGSDEGTYTILVTVPANKGFRVYMSAPGRKKVTIGERIVSRKDFPESLF